MDPALRPEDWQRHSAALRRVARRLLGKRDADADDLVQGTLLTAVQKPPRRVTLGWLARVLRHRVFDLGRRRRREQEARPPRPEPQPDTAGVVEKLESYEAVAAAVRELDEPYRRMVWLRWFEDLPPAEIARRLGLPVKTVKTRLHRALALLRGRLQGRYGREWQAALAPLIGMHVLAPALPTAAVVAGGIGLMGKRIAMVVLLALGVWGAWVLGSAMLAPPDVAPGGMTAGEAPVAEGGVPASGGGDAEGSGIEEEAPESSTGHRELARARSSGESATGGLRIRVLWHDGTPAADVAVGIGIPWNESGIPARTLDRVVSGGDGIARATRLPAGEVELRADRGAESKAEVVAGAVTDVDLQLEAGVAVEGIVVDADDTPVAGAGIWLTAHAPRWLGGRMVARSAADGTFTLRGIPPRQSLGATAEGFAPSAMVDLELMDTEDSPVSVRLQLLEGGGALAGTVLTASGEPAAGARVGVGKADSTLRSRRGSTVAERWAPRAVTCDGEGRFRFEGIPPGEHPLEVKADGHAIWHGNARVEVGETTDIFVQLPSPVTLAGLVRDGAGEPVAGASVRAFPVQLDETFLQGGQFDYDSIFGYPVTASDAEGRYRLDDVAPGEIHAYAMEPRRPRTERTYVRDQVVLSAAPGEALAWDPVLEPGHTIEGVVLYRDGEPLGRVFITAQDEETGKREVLYTGKDGRFRFVSLENHPYSVSVQIWDPPEGAPPVGETGVWPDRGELRLVTTWDKPVEHVPGTVSGRVHDAGGRLSGALEVILQSDKGWWRVNPDIEGDVFSFERLEPGRYQVVVLNGENPVHETDWFDLAPGEDKLLGTLVTVPPGALTLRFERSEGAEGVEPTVYLRREGGRQWGKSEPGTAPVHRVENLTPGDYTVRITGQGVATQEVPATVREGGDTEVEVRLRAAVLRALEIAYPEQPAVGSFEVMVRDEAGETFYDTTRQWSAGLGNPWTLRVRFPIGAFTARVTTDTGWSGEAAFAMESLEADHPPVRIELK